MEEKELTNKMKNFLGNMVKEIADKCMREFNDFEKQIEYANRKHQYECPECGKIQRFESEVTTIRCEECDNTFSTHDEKKSYTSLNERYGIDDPSDWKILDVNCLHEIINEKCEVQINVGGWSESRSYAGGDFNLIIKYLIEGVEYRYRSTTPTKKTHEELAKNIEMKLIKEMSDETNHENGLEGIVQDSLLFIIRKISEIIAGRKSMESE